MSAGQVSLKGKREARYRIVARFHSECELWRKGRVSGAIYSQVIKSVRSDAAEPGELEWLCCCEWGTLIVLLLAS